MTEQRLRVVVADDHAMMRAGMRAELDGPFEVVADCADATEAITRILKLQPDLVLTDLDMPDGGGRRVVDECATVCPIVIFTVSESERDLLDVVAAGAAGYLLKSTPGPELVDRLRQAAAGEPVFSPSLAALVLGEFRRIAKAAGTDPLSEREREVLRHVARGSTYAQVGRELYISPRTVENHVRNILGKLHLTRRADLIRYAVEHGIQ